MKLSNRDRKVLKSMDEHGLTFKNTHHFLTPKQAAFELKKLTAAGLMEMRRGTDRIAFYRLTDAGRALARA